MSNQATKTDNSLLREKVAVRLDALNAISKKRIRVLDAFGGDGVVWREVKKSSEKEISILRIEKRKEMSGAYLIGDNMKFLAGMDLKAFDLIDLDAYGVPADQLQTVLESGYCGIIVVTFIQTMMGNLPDSLLLDCGYTKEMISKARTLFTQDGMGKMESWLAKRGISAIRGVFVENQKKRYFWLRCPLK